MSGRGKYRKTLRNNISGVTKNDLKRIARRGGVKSMSALCYEEMRLILKKHLEDLIRAAVTYTESRRAKTVKIADVTLGIKDAFGVNYVVGRNLPNGMKKA